MTTATSGNPTLAAGLRKGMYLDLRAGQDACRVGYDLNDRSQRIRIAQRLETADMDITINTICPVYIGTPLVDAQIPAQPRANGISEQEVIEKIMLEPMPKKRFISIEEVTAATEFLIGDAARNITGQTLVIDGGWTVH